MLSTLPDPLQRFQVFRTSDAEEFRDALLTRFGASRARMDAPAVFDARGSLIQLQDILLTHGASKSGISIDYPEMDSFRFVTALAGRGKASIGGREIAIDERQSCIVSPGRAANIGGEGYHGWLTLRLRSGAVEQKLAALLGAKPRGKLEFAAAVDRDHPHVQGLWQLVQFFTAQLEATPATPSPLMLRELEQTVVVGFLCANRHAFSHLLEQDSSHVSPREIRLVEGYIEANWNRPLRIEDLAVVADVSVRSLFRSFRQARGYSPMAFAKLVRLKRARQMLAEGGGDLSVTAVASVCGFGNAGHFASDYRRRFGELPSETLARAR